jgi:cation channel sperm-associated protein 1
LFLFIFLLSPHAVYSIIFVILESFIFINLFIAVIVNNLQTQNEKVKKKKRQKARETVAGDVSMKEQEEFKLKSDKRPSQYSKDNMEGVGNSNKASRVGSEDMDLHYQEFNLPTWEKHIMSDFLMALAALDNNMESYQRTQQTLDDLVDLSLEEQKDDDANII